MGTTIGSLIAKPWYIRVRTSLLSLFRDQEAVGSNPATPTISSIHKGFDLWILDFPFIQRNMVLSADSYEPAFFFLCRFLLGKVFNWYALPYIGNIMMISRNCRYFKITNKSVIPAFFFWYVSTIAFSVIADRIRDFIEFSYGFPLNFLIKMLLNIEDASLLT